MILNTQIMVNSDCFRTGRKIKPNGIMVHSTATPGIMAAQWAVRWDKPGVKACVHAFLDDREVRQYLPWDHRGWHAGVSISTGKTANDTHISFEICEPAGHRYNPGSAVMVNYDVKKNEPYFRAAWKNAVELCVVLCKNYGLNDVQILDHNEGGKRGIAANSGDVSHWFPKHGESMDTFRAAVKKALKQQIDRDEQEFTVSQEEFNRMFATAMIDYNKKQAAQPPNEWAKEIWAAMCAAGTFDGSAPRSPLTREQAAMVLSRLKQ